MSLYQSGYGGNDVTEGCEVYVFFVKYRGDDRTVVIWEFIDMPRFEEELASRLLSKEPLFFLINSYTTGLSPMAMSYILNLKVGARFGGKTSAEELGLRVTETGSYLPCGASARWELEV